MQSEAYKISGFTLIISAAGFMLRWLQNNQIMDEETGLADPAAISWVVAFLIVAVGVVLAGLIFRLRRFDAPDDPGDALVGRTAFFGAISMIPAVLLIVAGMVQMVQTEDILWPVFHRLCGFAAVVGGVGSALSVTNTGKPDKGPLCRAGSVMMILFVGFWLITGYRDAATDPVTWRFVIEILADCVMLLGVHYVSGYYFGVPHPMWALFFCHYGAFLCTMCSIDEHSLGQSLMYVAMALLFIIQGFTVTENLKEKSAAPVRSGEEL